MEEGGAWGGGGGSKGVSMQRQTAGQLKKRYKQQQTDTDLTREQGNRCSQAIVLLFVFNYGFYGYKIITPNHLASSNQTHACSEIRLV